MCVEETRPAGHTHHHLHLQMFLLSCDTVFSKIVDHGVAGLHIAGAPRRRGMLSGQCAGGVGRVFETDLPSGHFLLCGVSGRCRFPGGCGGSASGCAGGRLGRDTVSRLSGSQLCGAGADSSFCALTPGYCGGPIPACLNTSEVRVSSYLSQEKK